MMPRKRCITKVCVSTIHVAGPGIILHHHQNPNQGVRVYLCLPPAGLSRFHGARNKAEPRELVYQVILSNVTNPPSF